MAAPPDRSRRNAAFRELRGSRSPGEFAAAVRRAAREIGEQVSCDARYVGRVEAGEIRCPNYAYERVFLHMFPGRSLGDLGFEPRAAVRGRRARGGGGAPPHTSVRPTPPGKPADPPPRTLPPLPALPARARTPGFPEAAVAEAVRRIRLHDDRHGADDLYARVGGTLRTARALLPETAGRPGSDAERLHAAAGELALSVGWLAHDSGRFADARSHYAEALATARLADDPALEAHAFSNTAFLARDTGRAHEAVRASQAGRRAAAALGCDRLGSLLAAREAGGWALLGDRGATREALTAAGDLFARGGADDCPEWMSFYGEAELTGLEAQCWAALGDHSRAAECARRAVVLQDPHFARNTALFTAELAENLAAAGRPDEAAHAAGSALALLADVRSARVRAMLDGTAERLRRWAGCAEVEAFLMNLGTVSA
ncbi:tetratricopeptide repeat protein [Streptomyces sp. WMMC500]|uniref:tetratricopeptide repeat protein n=1 Tax=Streptomyces sp. WMMC500 TaxID=3015154 RepID=UPI00248C55E8|nr:tetratricopeptide repeat protein [Streptomyces sp. WMMC500]WBB59146.1 tetratricopeptide repeat protein [Streptomyces sp. WMMC500]